jgi:single-stranded-DNA-specific exonuclease
MMLPRMSKRWVVQERVPEEIDQALANYPPFFRQILYARGVCNDTQAQAFFGGLSEIDDPFQLKDMEDTVRRLLWAIDHQERIAVYGDYDVDGVTATALLTQVLRRYGAEVIPYIPNRFDEGYGLNMEALETLVGQGVRVIVTVDCGIRSPREAERAEALGIDLMISDHHHPGEELPDAFTVICPKQGGDAYPDKNLSGVGLAYKIAQALALRRPEAGITAEDWLDLVALGTVADVVPLTGENRNLVRKGLQTMRVRMMQARPGLYSLANVARVKVPKISAVDIAFMLGPRLNAAGRLKTALDSLNLLLVESIEEAGLLSQNLDNQNRERQELTRKTLDEVVRLIQAQDMAEIVFAFGKEYNSGIVGLVASRLVETYYRPAIVGQEEDGFTRASCRSIPEFHITRALDECADLLERHGGHALAAGFTARSENIPALMTRLRGIAARELAGLDLRPVLRADLEIPLAKFRGDYVETVLNYLDMLQPTGQGNPEAVFISRNLEVVRSWTVGAEKQHLRLKVRAGNILYDAIAFRQGHLLETMPKSIDIVYILEKNEYNGVESLQLNVRDIRPAGEQE